MTKVQECLARNIKYYRKRQGMTQENLAEKAETATNYIGTIEIGKKFPSPKMIEKLATALDVDELALFSMDCDDNRQIDIDKLKETLIDNVNKTIEETLHERCNLR